MAKHHLRPTTIGSYKDLMESPSNSRLAESEPFSAEKYYSTQPAPAQLEDTLEGVRKFVAANNAKGRRIVLVTVSISLGLIAISR